MDKVIIGQQYLVTEDSEVKGFGRTEKIKKGTIGYVGADGFKYYDDGKIVLEKHDGFVRNNYDNRGIAKWIYGFLNRELPCFEEYKEDYEIGNADVLDAIEYALDELGF